MLKAPAAGVKPVKEKRKKGFAKVATKALPKPVFTTKAIGQTPGGDSSAKADDDREGTLSLPDSAFLKWIRAGNGDRPSSEGARDYLMRGAPFLGESPFEGKEAVKDCGARWVPNPKKQKGVQDGLVSGWWSAPNERVLERLLELPKTNKTTRSGRPWMVSSWAPWDCPPNQAHQIILLISEFETYQQLEVQKAHADRRGADERRRKQEELAGVDEDAPEEIEALRNEFGIEWDFELRESASQGAAAGLLGPKAGLSAVGRLLRGLRLEVVEPDDVRAGRFVDRFHKAQTQSRDAAGDVDPDAPTRDFNQEQGGTDCAIYFGATHPWMAEWPSESELEAARAAQIAPEPPGACSVEPLETYCLNCCRVIWCQFPRCSPECEASRDPQGFWRSCTTCGAMRCDPAPVMTNQETVQACLCDDKDAWYDDQREAAAHAPVDDGVEDYLDDEFDDDLLAYDPDKHTSSDDEDVPVYANEYEDGSVA